MDNFGQAEPLTTTTGRELNVRERGEVIETVYKTLLELYQNDSVIQEHIQNCHQLATNTYTGRGEISTAILQGRPSVYTQALAVATILARYDLPIELALKSFDPELLQQETNAVRTTYDCNFRSEILKDVLVYQIDFWLAQKKKPACTLDAEIKAAVQGVEGDLHSIIADLLDKKEEAGQLLFGSIRTDSGEQFAMVILLPADYPTA